MLVGKHKVSFHRFFYWGKAVFINGMKIIFGERKRKVVFINEMRTIFQKEEEKSVFVNKMRTIFQKKERKSSVHIQNENHFSKNAMK